MKTREMQNEVLESAKEFPVVAIYGPRQSGKTTLSRMCFPDRPWISFESPDYRRLVESDPRGFLDGLTEGAILDEIQRVPELLSYLQENVDRDGRPGRFVLTGSHQAKLKNEVAQSLAGRTAILTLLPYTRAESVQDGAAAGADDIFEAIFKGGYPRLHEQRIRPQRFFASYVATYLEQDLPGLLEIRNRKAFTDFLFLLAARTGSVFNASSLANDLGVSSPTIRAWVSALEESNLILVLRPWFRNAVSQATKSPKIYFTDTGLAAWLARCVRKEDVEGGLLRGGLYENHVIVEVCKRLLNSGETPDLYYYRDKQRREVDLIVSRQGRLTPVEIKSAATFSPDFAKGLRYFRETFVDADAGIIVFNGDFPSASFQDNALCNPLRDGWLSKILG
ncbi:MAG: ATP-binding protein [Zoogloeaceae bacterium]|jgi:predicted AAA+ superfamily ATPase|nr:ATP-binding protein [Zoogloeaceae bacterium]